MSAPRGFEQLEDRLLMAGNVTVTDGGSMITISGNDVGDLNNDIQIYTQLGSSGAVEIVVVGRNGTTVNGGAEAFVIQDVGDVNSIEINLNRGDDVLDINGLEGLSVIGFTSLRIDGGHGSDTIAVADVNAPNVSLYVQQPATNVESPNDPLTDDGNDVVSIGARQGVVSLAYIAITDTSGSNQVYVTDAQLQYGGSINLYGANVTTADAGVVYLSGVTSGSYINVNTGDGADTVVGNDLTISGGLIIETRGSNDDIAIHDSRSFGSLTVRGGVGTDAVNVYGSFGQSIGFENGSGGAAGAEERFGLYDTTVTGSLSVYNGSGSTGNDILAADRFFLAAGASGLNVSMGDGDDVVYLVNSGVRSGAGVSFDLGDGNDSLGLNNVDFSRSNVNVTGGTGDDNVSTGGGSVFRSASVSDSNGTNGFYFSDSAFRESLYVSTSTETRNTVYTARTRFLGLNGGGFTISTGGQSDSILLLDDSVFRGSFNLNTAGGNDTVTVNKATFTNNMLSWQLGDGDDALAVNGSRFQVGSTFILDGNAGANTAAGAGNTFNYAPSAYRFNTFSL